MRIKIRLLPILLLLIIAMPLSVKASEKTASRDDVIKLMKVMQVRKSSQKILDQYISLIKTNMASTPEASKAVDEFIKELDINQIIEIAIPIYQKHLTSGEINGAIKFFSSPSGQKVTTTLPAITQEVMTTVATWLSTGQLPANINNHAPTNKEQNIYKIFEYTGVLKEAERLQSSIRAELAKNAPDKDTGNFTKENIIKMYVSVFAKYLDDKTTSDLLAYYSSPTGKSFTAKQGIIQAETKQVTDAYTEKLINNFMKRYEKK